MAEETSPFLTDVLIGRETDRRNVINLLCNYSAQPVVAIVGVGGLGKTTLAHFVCQDDRVKVSFDTLLWVYITPLSSIREILEKIIESATGIKPINCNLEALQRQVFQELDEKKCLLVLDNVSYVDNLRHDAEVLNAVLKVGGFWANGGRVLITTRSKAVAKLVDKLELYELRDLAEDDCWIFLCYYAIKQDKKEFGIEEIGKKIATMCPKVPLVLKTVGRYLADKDYKSQWEHFRNELASEQHKMIKQILNLCHDQLDSGDNFKTNSNPVPDSCIISICEDDLAPSLSYDLFAHVLKTIRSKTIGNKRSFKLIVIALNVIAEGGQAAISQEKNDGKMGSNLYLELSIIISSFCLMMVLIEVFYEARKYGVVWQKRGRFWWWLYYRENQGRPFGSFSLYFGFISSMIQLIIHLTEKLTQKNTIKFDYMPLLLAVCYLVAAIIDHPGEVSGTDQGSITEDHESRV